MVPAAGPPWWWPNAAALGFAGVQVAIALIDHWLIPSGRQFGDGFDLGLLAAAGITSAGALAHAVGLQTPTP